MEDAPRVLDKLSGGFTHSSFHGGDAGRAGQPENRENFITHLFLGVWECAMVFLRLSLLLHI